MENTIKNQVIKIVHKGDDYITVQVGDKDYDVEYMAQYIIIELLRRLKAK